jgi:hypothetical protein
MRGCTLVVALAGGDPPPLEILVKRLVQQLQTHISDLRFCTDTAEYEKQGRMKCPAIRLPGPRRGSGRPAPRPAAPAARALPSSSIPLDLPISSLSRKLPPTRAERPPEGRGIGYKRRALRCNKQSRYVGQGAGTVEIVQSGR